MTTAIPVRKALHSKSVLLILLLGNLALALTIFLQDRIIDNQRQLIHLLYVDSAELANYKISAAGLHHHK